MSNIAACGGNGSQQDDLFDASVPSPIDAPKDWITIKVRFEGHGAGVLSDGNEIRCTEDCELKVQSGERLELLAQADGGDSFVAWFGMCSGEGAKCAFVPTDGDSLTLHFAHGQDVLVIANQNSVDSVDVAKHYATARGIDADRIAQVQSPASYFIAWNEFERLRDQIIVHLLNNTLDDPGLSPATCPADSPSPFYCEATVAQIREHSTIRYLVTTRGVPTRVRVDESSLSFPGDPTSVDNYLRFWLANFYEADTSFDGSLRAGAFANGRGQRSPILQSDKELIIGRVDGLDTDSAKALVDRAIAAEEHGLYGTLIGSQFKMSGATRLRDHSQPSRPSLTGEPEESWRYQLALMGENRDECSTFLDESPWLAEGKAPLSCQVRLTDGSDRPPGQITSRMPSVQDAVVYLGSLDGQETTGSFSEFLEWRRNAECNTPLCADTDDPAACSASSSDPYGEINTDCAGVADGFIGYNWQSFPVSYLASWPTGWFHAGNRVNWNHLGGGSYQMALPEVRTDIGRTDDYSLWFRNAEQIPGSLCFADDINLDTASTACPTAARLNLQQQVSFPGKALSTIGDINIRVGFWYRTENLATNAGVRLLLYGHNLGGNEQREHFRGTLNVSAGTNDWTYRETTITLDPDLQTDCSGDCIIDGIKIRLETNVAFEGALAFDDFSIVDVDNGQELAINPSFDDGHRQVAGGDHAANFLSRVGGTAFWGSLSHHGTGGHSFSSHPVETLAYFLRGLPLGDSVWYSESFPSGIMYGDPLYSPTAVRMYGINDPGRRIDGEQLLFVDAVNGTLSDSTFAIDYCPGANQYQCDKEGTWLATGLSGTGGARDIRAGLWSLPAEAAWGPYTLRLRVDSNNPETGAQQSLFDFQTVHNWKGCNIADYPYTAYPTPNPEDWLDSDGDGEGNPCDEDDDGDGVLDEDDVFPFDPNESFDFDGDGIGDNADEDDDNDGMSDAAEAINGLDPMVDDSHLDADGDGIPNLIEIRRGTDAQDPNSVPALATWTVGGGGDFATLGEAITNAGAGDTIEIFPGDYPELLQVAKTLTVVGQPGAVVRAIRFVGEGDGCHLSNVSSLTVQHLGIECNHSRVFGVRATGFANFGGINVYNADDVILENVVASSVLRAGALIGESSSVRVISSTFVGPAALSITESEVQLDSVIAMGTTLDAIFGVPATISYSTVFPSGEVGPGASDVQFVDPLFIDAASGDLHLAPGSPAIDSGNPALGFSLEAAPNGGRINAGGYGNTAEAQFSP